MDLLRWFRRTKRPVHRGAMPRPVRSFRPSIAGLEDRVVPAAIPIFANLFSAAKMQVTAPSQVEVGKTFNVTVTALTGLNRVATTYRGTVQFSLGTTDALATLPANYKFTPADAGVKTFAVTLGTAANQAITVFDVGVGTLRGTAATKAIAPVVLAPAVTQFSVQLPSRNVWGQPASVIVTALDATGQKVPGYTGTISFASSDAVAFLPPKYQFTAADQGSRAFLVNFRSLGAHSLAVSDVAAPSSVGVATTTVTTTGPVARFAIYTVGFNMAGSTSAFTVVALDVYGQVVSDYVGTVKFSSSDAKAGLPGQYTFTAADRGARLFYATFSTAGYQRLAVADASSSAIFGFYDLAIMSPFTTGVKYSPFSTQFFVV